MAVARRPRRERHRSAPSREPVATTTRVVAVSMARIHGAGSSCARHRSPRGSAGSAGLVRLERDRPRGVARALDAHVEAAAGSGVAEPIRPLDERDAGGLALVDQAARQRVRRRRRAGTDRCGRAAAGPSYSAMRMKLGEVIVSVTPRPAPNALARWVLPAPRSPHRQTRSPALRARRPAESRPAEDAGSGVAGSGHTSDPASRPGGRRRDACALRRSARGRRAGRRPSSLVEADEAGLEVDAAGEAARTGQARPSGPRDRPAGRPGCGRGRAGGAGSVESGSSKTSIGGSATIATSRPSRASRMAMTGRRRAAATAPSRTSTANGGRRWRAARWRSSEARKSRRSLLARPATMMPRTPIARARVSVSASIARADHEDRARPSRRRGRRLRSSPSAPGDVEAAAGRAAERDDRRAARGRRPGSRCALPGRTSRTMPATGVSSGSVTSPPATRQRPRHSNSSSPVGDATARRRGSAPIGRDDPGRSCAGRAGARRSARRPRPTRRPPRAARSPGASGNVTSSGPGRAGGAPDEPEVGTERARDRRRRRRRRAALPCPRRRSRVRPRPQRRLPRGEQVAPPVGPIGQAQRDVAQVDEQAAQAARRRRSRSGGRAPPRRTRVAELELGDRGHAGRQVDELEAARHEVELASVAAVGVHDDRRRPTRPARRPAGVTTLPSGARRSSARSAQDAAARRRRGSRRAGRAAGRGRARTGWPRAGGCTSTRARATAGAGTAARHRRRPRRDPAAGRSPIRASRPARRPSAARAAAMRRAAPSPAASDHGAIRSSRRRSRRRCRSARHGRPGQDAVDDGVVRLVGSDARPTARWPGRLVDGRPPAPGWPRRATPASWPSDDRLDPPVEDLGQRPRSPAPERAGAGRRAATRARAGGRRAGPGIRLGRAAATDGGRRQQDLAGPRRRRRRARPGLRTSRPARTMGSSGRRRGDGGHEGGQLLERAALVGARRVACADEDRLDAVVEQQPRHRQRVGRLGARGRRSASRSAPAVATSAASVRSEPATTASRRGRWLRTSSRGSRLARQSGEAERSATTGSAAIGPGDQQIGRRVEVGTRRDGEAADEPPARRRHGRSGPRTSWRRRGRRSGRRAARDVTV